MAKDDKKDQRALDEAAAQDAAAAAASAVTQAAPPDAPPAPKVAPRNVGDVPVTCLKTEPYCALGDRRYQLVKGQEIMMDPSHAAELASGGWVAIVSVIGSD